VWGLFLKVSRCGLRASWAISFWVLFQVGAAFFGGDESVGWFAHLGGLGVGALLVLVMRPPRCRSCSAEPEQPPRCANAALTRAKVRRYGPRLLNWGEACAAPPGRVVRGPLTHP
jgi:hypothetical protein